MLNRRQMLGGLLVPLIPSFLRPKKSKPRVQKPPKDKPWIVTATIKGGSGFLHTDHGWKRHTSELHLPLDIIRDTETKTVAKFAGIGLITSIKLKTENMEFSREILSPESTIRVHRGEVLVVSILHHYKGLSHRQARHRQAVESTFILGKDQESTALIMDYSGICGFVPHTRQEVPFRTKWNIQTHQIEYYDKQEIDNWSKDRLIGVCDMCWTADQSKQYSRPAKLSLV